jgi:hypothetical protein
MNLSSTLPRSPYSVLKGHTMYLPGILRVFPQDALYFSKTLENDYRAVSLATVDNLKFYFFPDLDCIPGT